MKKNYEIDKLFEIIEYFDDDNEKAKKFINLQKNVRYFLFIRKIKILNQLGILDGIYIKTAKCRPLIKSKNTPDKYMSAPINKYHIPLTKIIMIQYNYRMHLKYMKKFPSYKINKLSLNKCPLITKETPIKRIINEELYKNIKNKVINTEKSLCIKLNYNYTPLLLIQRKYKERYKYMKENFKLKKHAKIFRTVVNRHHYIYHAIVIDATEQVSLIQKNIKYFLYRQHAKVNLIPKKKIDRCTIKRTFGFRVLMIKCFYEEFVTRIVNIIKQYFLSYYLKIMKKHYITQKINQKKEVNVNTEKPIMERKRNSFKTETNMNYINKVKAFKRKETFSVSLPKPKPVTKQQQRHSSLLNTNDSNPIKEKTVKKKVSFKNEPKINPLLRKDSKNVRNSFSTDTDIKNKKNNKNENNIIKRKQTMGAIKFSPSFK